VAKPVANVLFVVAMAAVIVSFYVGFLHRS